jgi:hypothetical protein
MTKDQAIEKCGKAMAKRQGRQENDWRQIPAISELAADLVTSLEALGLFTYPDEFQNQVHTQPKSR